MTENFLEKIFEHNNWANLQILRGCSGLSDEQLDCEPQSATQGSIRSTLIHLAAAQRGYLRILTLHLEERMQAATVEFDELEEALLTSGEELLRLVRAETDQLPTNRLQTRDGYYVEPWVLMVQIINHATEHREQIKSMLTALGVTPPNIDGWDYGEVTEALIPIPPSLRGGS